MMEWLETEFEVPWDDQIVLCCDIHNNFVSLGRYQGNEDTFLLMNIDGIEIDSCVTHWMPLPSPPKIS